MVSETILRRLLNQDIVRHIKCKGKDKNDPSMFIFTQGKSVDYFVLILEGRVEVTIGREGLMFESGPFTYFGTQALAQSVGVGKFLSTLHNVSVLNTPHFQLNHLNSLPSWVRCNH